MPSLSPVVALLGLAAATGADTSMRAFVAPSALPSSFYYDDAFPLPSIGQLSADLELPPSSNELKLRV